MSGILLLSIVSNFGTQVIEMRVFSNAYTLETGKEFQAYDLDVFSMTNLFMV